MRTKIMNEDGWEAKVSPLTVDQVAEYLERLAEATKGHEDADAYPESVLEKLKQLAWRNVASGLNNAHIVKWNGESPVYDDDFTPWTPERVRRELDLVLIAKIREQVYEMSGLKAVRPGEPDAVSRRVSPSSEAA